MSRHTLAIFRKHYFEQREQVRYFYHALTIPTAALIAGNFISPYHGY
jgi:hypothetical protein